VKALIDIPILKVDRKVKDKVLEAMVEEEGPTDGTVIISASDDAVIPDENADRILEEFSTIGEIILAR